MMSKLRLWWSSYGHDISLKYNTSWGIRLEIEELNYWEISIGGNFHKLGFAMAKNAIFVFLFWGHLTITWNKR